MGSDFFVCGTGDCVHLRGDNDAAVQWVRRCRGGTEPRSGALMRLLGVLELSSGWHFDAKHVRGIFNVAAEGNSRWGRSSVLLNLRCSPRRSVAGSGFGGRRDVSLYFGDGIGLMRSAVAASSERD